MKLTFLVHWSLNPGLSLLTCSSSQSTLSVFPWKNMDNIDFMVLIWKLTPRLPISRVLMKPSTCCSPGAVRNTRWSQIGTQALLLVLAPDLAQYWQKNKTKCLASTYNSYAAHTMSLLFQPLLKYLFCFFWTCANIHWNLQWAGELLHRTL